MEKLILFAILTVIAVTASWRTLFNIKSHGFYRFFSWECIIWLFVSDYKVWFVDPLSTKQIISWLLLLLAVYMVIAGIILMKRIGKPGRTRDEKTLYQFEKTTELIDQGIFKYIRHPLYGSLIFLTWGIFFKNTTILLFFVSLVSTVFLYITARLDEKECTKFFGEKYSEYMKHSKMFIPFLL